MSTRLAMEIAAATVLAALPLVPSVAQDRDAVPPFAARGMPGAGHAALQALVGTWRVEKTTFVAGGTPDKPLRGTLTCRRELIADGRFVRDVTEGQLAGKPYYRLGLLGYSNEDRRYEWVTADALNANMMIYLGRRGSGPAGPSAPITVSGTFSDQGLISQATAGKPIAQRTVFRVEGPDRHVVELYFTPPGAKEFLADRAVYTRTGS